MNFSLDSPLDMGFLSCLLKSGKTLRVVLAKNTAEKMPVPEASPRGWPRLFLAPGSLSMDPGPLTRSSGSWSLPHPRGGPSRTGGRSSWFYSPSQNTWATGSAISATSQGMPAAQTRAEARKPPEGAPVPCWDPRFGRWAPEPQEHTVRAGAGL